MLPPMGYHEAFVSTTAALCIGCCWSLSQFMWANIENINAFYAWPGLIALALLFNFVRKHSVWVKNRRYCCWLGNWHDVTLQLYASIYLLLFSCILIGQHFNIPRYIVKNSALVASPAYHLYRISLWFFICMPFKGPQF